MQPIRLAVAATLASLLPASAANAQSFDPGAKEFASQVRTACTAAASAALDDVAARIDPVGSRNYGLALLSGVEKGTRNTRSVLCVYDRQSRRAEVGSLLDLRRDAVDPASNFPVENRQASPSTAATLIYPGSATCGQDCLALWTALSADDQNQLSALPEQVRRTLAETQPGDEPAPTGAARMAAEAIVAAAAGSPDGETAPDLSGVAAGSRRCTHYWFGYENEAARVEDRFDCKVDRLPNGGFTVTRTSGKENLVYQVQLLGTGLALIGGRNAPAGPPPGGYDLSRLIDPIDANYGNEVGLGVADPDGRFFAASINERGIEPKDPSFFQMVVIEPPGRR